MPDDGMSAPPREDAESISQLIKDWAYYFTVVAGADIAI